MKSPSDWLSHLTDLTGGKISPHDFFLINILILIFLAIWFLTTKRKPNQPTRLKMGGAKSTSTQSTINQIKKDSVKNEMKEPNKTTKKTANTAFADRQSPSAPPKDLNIIFIYNGHAWDAYEVLGIPAGSSLATAKSKYEQTSKDLQGATIEFYEAAFRAIEEKLNSRTL